MLNIRYHGCHSRVGSQNYQTSIMTFSRYSILVCIFQCRCRVLKNIYVSRKNLFAIAPASDRNGILGNVNRSFIWWFLLMTRTYLELTEMGPKALITADSDLPEKSTTDALVTTTRKPIFLFSASSKGNSRSESKVQFHGSELSPTG